MAALDYLIKKSEFSPIPVIPVPSAGFSKWLKKQNKDIQAWIAAHDYKGAPASILSLPGKKGSVDAVLVGIGEANRLWDYASLPAKLPIGDYEIKTRFNAGEADDAALGWALGTYCFDWYKESTKDFACLVWPKSCDKKRIMALAEGIELTRDLINIPAADMGPNELAKASIDLAGEFDAAWDVIVDEELINQNFPAIYAVGKGAADDRRPCLIDLSWGNRKDPKVTLVGKGVCFDTGGLDIKPAQFMKLMKKDMGGAAHVLGLAKAIMSAKLPIRLRVIIPAVENAVSDRAMRPSDVVDSRKGTTIEIGHTDAEGRVVLADCLALASEEKPDMILDFATLTGAARVALGTELPALFASDDKLANDLLIAGQVEGDNMWRMPLWQGYRSQIEGKTGDISNESSVPYGGAITAALFLQEFVDEEIPWAHMDIMGWNTSSKPGKPEGGEAMGLRAAFTMLKNRY